MAKDAKQKKHFFKDFKAELKRVIWPTPKQLVKNTIAVVVIVILTAAIVFILDGIFNLLNRSANKVKSKIKDSVTTTQIQNVELNSTEEAVQVSETQENVESAE